MKICITVGHSILKNGLCTSADGRPYGGCLEYKWSKSFGKKLRNALIKRGHDVTFVVCPEGTLDRSDDERVYKLNIVNRADFDLLIELHLNAFDDPSANGTCTLYKSVNGSVYAEEIDKRLATIFRDRGAIKRDNLYILNQTKPVAVLLETFFCTNVDDYSKGRGKKNKKKIAALVADGIEAGYSRIRGK